MSLANNVTSYFMLKQFCGKNSYKKKSKDIEHQNMWKMKWHFFATMVTNLFDIYKDVTKTTILLTASFNMKKTHFELNKVMPTMYVNLFYMLSVS